MWAIINRCVLCDDALRSSFHLCELCHSDLPFNTNPCIGCALPMNIIHHNKQMLCGSCIAERPLTDRTFSPFVYDFPIDNLIKRYKFHNQVPLGRILIDLAWDVSKTDLVHHSYDAIIPIPLHWVRQLQRGFNQAELLSNEIGYRLKIPVRSVIYRKKNNPQQSQLHRQQRQQNLRNTFYIQENSLTALEKVLIVDDVITTGETIQTVSKLLVSSGIKHVDAWALARTQQF